MLLSDLVSSKIRRSSNGSKANAICFTVNLRWSDVCNEAILEYFCIFDFVSSKRLRYSDGSKSDAICLTVNSRRSDVHNGAILECYCPILFLLKYDGLMIVRMPTQFLPLSISVDQMFVFKHIRYVIKYYLIILLNNNNDIIIIIITI